jgi:hypothetical protein
MASVPHRLGEERATVPRIVLPITSRGLVVTDRVCWGILAAAMAVAAGLILYLNRGTSFYLDEITWVYQTPGLDSVGDVLERHNGHLIATTRLVYKAILETIGAEYIAFRLIAVSAVLLSAALFYELVKRRIGALPALAPTLVLLFLGSAWQHVVGPIGFTPVFSIAAGLAALLALEGGDRRGDIAACAFLVVSVATYTTGLPFLVGVAVSVLIQPDRLRRAWIFLVPLALYAAWWLGSLSTADEGDTSLVNALLIPNWWADALATVMAALSGLGFDFAGEGPFPAVELGWGRILAVAAVAALVLRIRRGNVAPSTWSFIAIALTWWTLGALAFGLIRTPDSVRYIYLGAVAVLLVAAAALPPIRFSRAGLVALFAAAAFSLGANITLLRDGGAVFRDISARTQAQFGALELARGHVSPDFDPLQDPPVGGFVLSPASTYFAVADRYGSLGFPPSELEGQAESIRQNADQILARALELQLEAAPSGPPAARCEEFSSNGAGEAIGFQLPAGGATLRVHGAATGPLLVGRFGSSPSAEVGTLPPGGTATLAIPEDSSPRPWIGAVTGARSVEVCPLS